MDSSFHTGAASKRKDRRGLENGVHFTLPKDGQVFVKDRNRSVNSTYDVGDDAGHQAGEEDGVFDAPQIQDLDAEERAGHGRPEHGSEASANSANHQAPTILVLQP